MLNKLDIWILKGLLVLCVVIVIATWYYMPE